MSKNYSTWFFFKHLVIQLKKCVVVPIRNFISSLSVTQDKIIILSQLKDFSKLTKIIQNLTLNLHYWINEKSAYEFLDKPCFLNKNIGKIFLTPPHHRHITHFMDIHLWQNTFTAFVHSFSHCCTLLNIIIDIKKLSSSLLLTISQYLKSPKTISTHSVDNATSRSQNGVFGTTV